MSPVLSPAFEKSNDPFVMALRHEGQIFVILEAPPNANSMVIAPSVGILFRGLKET